MHTPRILIIATTFLPVVGGVQYFMKWFLDNLDRRLAGDRAFEVHFGYPNDKSERYLGFQQMQTHDLGFQGFEKYRVAGLILRIGRLLTRVRPDVVHCHSVTPDGLCVLLASRMFGVHVKVVVTSHGQDVVSLPGMGYGALLSPRGRFFARQVTRRLSAHVVVSQAMVEHALMAGTRRELIEVIQNGVPMDGDFDFEAPPDEKVERNKATRLPALAEGGIYVLSLSSGRRIKNLVGLVEAMHLAGDELGASKLILACTGPLAAPIRRLVEEKGLSDRVLFVGELAGARKRALFEASDVYCLPSYFESFGLAALEAMKFGSAVVATREGGVPDFVEQGENGLLISPADPSEIASALVRLYKAPDLRARLVENGLATAKRFSISSALDDHLHLYRRILDDGRGRV